MFGKDLDRRFVHRLVASEVNSRLHSQAREYDDTSSDQLVGLPPEHLKVFNPTYAIQPDATRFLLECCPEGWDTERYTNEIISVLYPILITSAVVRTPYAPIRELSNKATARLLLRPSKTSPFIKSALSHFDANWKECQIPLISSMTSHS